MRGSNLPCLPYLAFSASSLQPLSECEILSSYQRHFQHLRRKTNKKLRYFTNWHCSKCSRIKGLFEIKGVIILGTALFSLATLLEFPPSALFPLVSCTPTLSPSPLTIDCRGVVLLTKLFLVLFRLALIVRLSGMGHKFHSTDLLTNPITLTNSIEL